MHNDNHIKVWTLTVFDREDYTITTVVRRTMSDCYAQLEEWYSQSNEGLTGDDLMDELAENDVLVSMTQHELIY